MTKNSAEIRNLMTNLKFENLPEAMGILYDKLDRIETLLLNLNKIEDTPKHKEIEAPDEFISRREAAKILKVSLPTLGEWSKAGIVKSYRIATRVRYKRKELEKALKAVKVS